MDQRPKRNRDKDNPYFLHSDEKNDIYIVQFSNGDSQYNIEISKDLFYEFDNIERYEARKIQYDKRYLEQSYQTDISLYNKAINKPLSVEDKTIKDIDYKKLNRAIGTLSKMHRRRILLYYDYNLSLSEIAEIEGCSKVAIKYSIDVALKQLREYFEKN